MSVWALHDIRKTWSVGRWPRTERRVALDGVSLSVAPGERVALVGPSGSGKSTLVRCGLGLVAPDSGRVELLGEATRGWTASRWRRARRDAQLLVQDPRAMLHPYAPIGALLADSAALHRPGSDPRAEAARALAEVGLADRADALPRELSGGEQRRVGLARVLVSRPRLLVADEPTAGLDAAIKPEMLELMLERVGPECAVVLVSHDLPMVARYCGRVVVVDEGRVVERFDTSALKRGWRPDSACASALVEAAGWEAP